jgi:hypothetical protein
LAANGWMNTPQGFALTADGRVVNADPVGAMLNPSTMAELVHMLFAAFMVVGFTVASVYAVGMLRGRQDRYHRLALLIPLTGEAIATPVQTVVGDWIADVAGEQQPAKLAAMEGLFRTGYRAMLDVPRELGAKIAALLRGERRRRGIRRNSRAPSCWKQALLGLVRHLPGHRLPLPRRGRDRVGRPGPGPARGAAASRRRGVVAPDPGRQGLPHQPMRRDHDQRERCHDPLLVLRETPRLSAGTFRRSCARTGSRSGPRRWSPVTTTT